jgi:mono/diheme cytochrome c family protein
MGNLKHRWIVVALVATATVAVASAQPPTSTTTAAPQAPVTALRTFTPQEIAAMAETMPAGLSRELTVRVCAQCHEPQRAAALRLTRDGWEGVVAKMIGLGAKATDDEFAKITDYLAENFKGEAPRPINMNTASSIELESVAGLLRKEAAAWIAHRNTHPPCKSLDDLKKVVGVPFKKIDERRDRLVCF